jgi:membrane-associated protease RseP (regulator of RpoE activity)
VHPSFGNMGNELFWWLPGCAVGYVIGTVAHEAGHLLAAMIGSTPVDRVVIGSGPVLMRGRIGKLRLELCRLPVGGLVMPAAAFGKFLRLRLALFFVGGVLGNIAVIGVIARLDVARAVPTILQNIGGPLVFTQIFIIVTNLVPRRTTVDGEPAFSDGLQLVRVLFGLFTRPWIDSLARLNSGERWTNEDVRRKIWEALRRELARDDLLPAEESLVLDFLVTDGLIFADPALHPELNAWSLRALQIEPEAITLIGSRGAVLVEIGRYQEGKSLLETVMFNDEAAPFDLFMSRIFLARAEHALGNVAAAGEFMMDVPAILQTGATGPAMIAMIERIKNEMRAVP